MNVKNIAIGVAVVALGWAIGSDIIDSHRQTALKAATTQLHVAQDSLHKVTADVVARDKIAAAAQAAAASEGTRAETAAKQAAVLGGSVKVLEAKLDSALKDSTSLEDAKVLFDSMDAYADSLKSELVAKTEQVDTLTAALLSERHAVAELVPAATAVDTAANKVLVVVRPSLFVRLAPRTGFGAAVGIDQSGKPAIVLGFTLSWPH